MQYSQKNQSGAILAVCLMFLAVLTLLTVTNFNASTMGEKMTGNVLNHNVAFQAADSALRNGEGFLRTAGAPPDSVTACTAAPCDVWGFNVLADPLSYNHAWWTTNGRAFNSSLGTGGIATQPRHVIEEQMFVPDDLSPETAAQGLGVHYYRVTARGTGGNDNADAMVQSIYVMRYN